MMKTTADFWLIFRLWRWRLLLWIWSWQRNFPHRWLWYGTKNITQYLRVLQYHNHYFRKFVNYLPKFLDWNIQTSIYMSKYVNDRKIYVKRKYFFNCLLDDLQAFTNNLSYGGNCNLVIFYHFFRISQLLMIKSVQWKVSWNLILFSKLHYKTLIVSA